MRNDPRRAIEREAELRAYAVLGAEDIPTLERVVDLAAALCGAAVAEINVVSTADVVHVATTTRDHRRVPREHSFCSHVIEHDADNFTVHDARSTLPFARSPYVTGERGSIRSYASARLVAPTGTVLGTLCVFDEVVREFDEDQLATLRLLAALVVDVLEHRREHRELAGSVARLADSHREVCTSNEALDGFAAQVSHDLQAPVATLGIALSMLEDRARDEESAQVLDIARSGVRRMQQMIADLLDFAVLGSGRPPAVVDLDRVARQVVDDLGSLLASAKVEVGPLPRLLGHESEVRVVLQNLVANAVKFAAPHRVPRVVVAGEVRGDRVRVTVTDNGPGVPEDARDDVFAPHVRAETTVPGYGIGLATCARVIRARGGTIGVDPAPAGGATFWFELPAG
ncbi:MAG: HAMP domain-containing histidine kinase [Nocardioidaceae bacterium]|nr:HAMP domain-containing histidine kinase [Nocardioidaceae bacterium]